MELIKPNVKNEWGNLKEIIVGNQSLHKFPQ